MGETTGRRGRPELVRARKRLGMSQVEAAEALLVTPTTLSRWERGSQEIRPVYRARMAAVFGVSPEQVERWLECTEPVATELWPWPDFADMSLASTLKSAERLWRSELDLQRRHMLAALPFVPNVLDGWISAWSYGSSMESAASEGSGRAVGLSDVRRVEEARQRFWRIDHEYGGGLIRPAVIDYLNTTVASLLRGTYNDKVGSALLTAAAEMTLFAGWTAFDTEHHGQAQHYYGQALKLAKAADDPLAGAHVLSTMAHQAIHLNKPEKALLLARAAVEAGRRAQASPQVMALLHVREARAAALRAHPAANGDRHTAKQIERLLLEAERAHGQGASDRDPQWACEFDEPELAAQFGIVWHLLGDNDRAADHLEHSIRAFATYRPRSSHLNRVNVAETYLSKGELEQALDHARAATTGATALTSPRLIGHVKRFDKRLKPYENTIQVREFRAYLDHATAV
jgi:Aldo/keto reductases, related to diketogulonate reductase